MNHDTYRDWLETFHSRTPQILRKVELLVGRETPSLNPTAIQGMVEYLARELKSYVDTVEVLPDPVYGPSLLAEYQGLQPSLEPILIIGHADTVWPLGTLKERPFTIDCEQDRAYGPGIFDMKGGIALVWEWFAWASATRYRPQRTVRFLMTPDEEIGSHGGRPLIERFARESHHVIVPEPPGEHGEMKIQRKGIATYQYHFTGVAAHAGVEPWQGASAVLEAARTTLWFHQLTPPSWSCSFNVGRIEGGTVANVVPEEAVLLLDARFDSAENAVHYRSLLEDLRTADPRVHVKVSLIHERPPMTPSPETIAMVNTLKQHLQTLGYSLSTIASGGGSDGNFTAAMGIPTLDGVGPEGGHPHSPKEFLRISTLPQRMTLLALTIHLF